jgi:hypothetical protein
MSTTETMSIASQVLRELFLDAETPVYAVLDGASVPGLQGKLAELKPEFCCLYRGPIPAALENAAPYLIRLFPDHPITAWIVEQGWGKHWGIFVQSPEDFREMRKHFRKFLRVRRYDGPIMIFRYYDPRVLRIYLPTCNVAETAEVFGPIRWYACEAPSAGTLLRFLPVAGDERTQSIDLTAGGVIPVKS